MRVHSRTRALAPILLVASALMVAGPADTALAAPHGTHVFHVDPTSAVPAQDQLTLALARAAGARETVVLPKGGLTVTRSLLLPAHSSLRLARGAVIRGSVPGQSLVRMTVGSHLSGGHIVNASSADCFDVDFAAEAAGTSITGVQFGGARTNAVYLSAAGLRNVTIRDNSFDHVTYGVLLNPGARRASALHITGNDFSGITGDAIEINAAVTSDADLVHHVEISGNTIHSMPGSGVGSGFGVGVAGVRHFYITDNRFLGARHEAVHLEDRSTDGVVANNLVRGGGVASRPAIAVYRSVSSVVIRRNTVTRFAGSGIAVLWDSIGSSKRISITNNLVSFVKGEGVVVGGDAGTGPFVVRDNRIIDAGGFGVVVLGTHAYSAVEGNLIRSAGAGMIRSAYRGGGTRVYRDNGPHPTSMASPATRTGSTLKVTS